MKVDLTQYTMEQIKQLMVQAHLDMHDGNRTYAAKSLDIGIRTVQRSIIKQGLPRNPDRKTEKESDKGYHTDNNGNRIQLESVSGVTG